MTTTSTFKAGDKVRVISGAKSYQSPLMQADNQLAVGTVLTVAECDWEYDVYPEGMSGCIASAALELVKGPQVPSVLVEETKVTKRFPEGNFSFRTPRSSALIQARVTSANSLRVAVGGELASTLNETRYAQYFEAPDLREAAAYFNQLADDLDEINGEGS